MAAFITKRNATITLAAGADSYTFNDVGDFSADNLQESNSDAVPIMHRGAFAGYVQGDDVPCNLSFSTTAQREKLTDAASEVQMDVIRKAGMFAAATTTNPGSVGPMTWTLTYSVTYGATTTTMVYANVRIKASLAESGPATVLSISGTAFGVTCT
jgi:hypothetical protein